MFSNLNRRFLHLSSSLGSVRVRFAPSPTGYIHLGGIRTALYNFLFAKSQNGAFILRIEDTDQKRLVPGAAAQLECDLEWMGLSPDESPLKGGNYGPYTQSQRLPLYEEAVKQLVKDGHAYPCFCTDRRLEFVKKEAMREGAIPRYDNRCRSLSDAAIEEKKQQGLPYCIRFKLGPLDQIPVDLVYGLVDCAPVEHEGDPVIWKQDGFPTYHLANVVDDHYMEITHVLRGNEWLISTPKHVLLYKAFNWKPPQFAHLPLIVNSDGTKLSKRQDDIRLEHFRDRGYFPEAITGFLCLAGGGFRAPDIQREPLSVTELTHLFQLEDMTTHPGRLDPVRLDQFNRSALQNRLRDQKQADRIARRLKDIIHQTLAQREMAADSAMLERSNLMRLITWAVDEGRITCLEQLVEPSMQFLWSQPKDRIASSLELGRIRRILEQVSDMLASGEALERQALNQRLRRLATENGAKFAEVMKLLRSSLTGLNEGPSVADVIDILGPETCVRRLRSSLALLK